MRVVGALLVLAACLIGASAQAPSTQVFKAAANFLGYKPVATDTIFAPSDAAVAAFAKAWGLTDAKELLTPTHSDLMARVMSYHLHEAGALRSSALRSGQQLPTMNGAKLTVASAGGVVTLKGAQNSAKVVAADLKEGPATVHVIDAVLLPPDVFPSITAALTARPDTKQLLSLVKADSALATKAGNPLFGGTFFAPSDYAFNRYKVLDKVAFDKAFSKNELELVLYYHSSPTPYGFDQLRALPPNKTIESSLRIGNVPEPIYHERNTTSVNVWGQLNLKDRATIVAKDILVGSGVMHVVDFPLIPDLDTAATQSIANALKGQKELSTMSEIITRTGILDQLDSPLFSGTLFAPTNQAFEAFVKRMGYDSVQQIYDNEVLMDAILGFHLIPVAYSDDKLNTFAPFSIKPFTGGTLRLGKTKEGKVFVRGGQNSANLVKAGLDAGRSAVHMTDNVLLPDDVFYTIMMALEYYPESSILQNLVDATPDLAKVANNPRTNVTVFAPGNSAFLLVGPTFIPRLEADNRTRLNGLNYHISPGARFVPGGFPAGSRIPTLLKGQDIGVKIAVTKGAGGKEQGTVVLVPTSGPDATIAVPNIIAGRSVIHGISRLLAPASSALGVNGGRKLLQNPLDTDTVTGTNVLRTNRYSRLTSSSQGAIASNDVQSAAQAGDTNMLINTQASYTAARTSREYRADQGQDATVRGLQLGGAVGATNAATGASAMFSNAAVMNSDAGGVRSQLAQQVAQDAVRSALDNPANTGAATAQAASVAQQLSFPTNYETWQ